MTAGNGWILPTQPIVVRQSVAVKAMRVNWLRNIMIVTLSLAIGFATIIGGEVRWAGEAFQVALQAPGTIYTWGIALIVYTLVFSVGAFQQYRDEIRGVERRHWFLIVGALLCSTWNFALAYCQLTQMSIDPTEISWNGPIVWLWLAFTWVLKAAIEF